MRFGSVTRGPLYDGVAERAYRRSRGPVLVLGSAASMPEGPATLLVPVGPGVHGDVVAPAIDRWGPHAVLVALAT